MIGLRWSLRGVGLIGLGLWSLICYANAAQPYIPDGPDVPAIVLNESQGGAEDLPPL